MRNRLFEGAWLAALLVLAVSGLAGALAVHFTRTPSLTTLLTVGIAGVASAMLAFFLAIPAFAPFVIVCVAAGAGVARLLLLRHKSYPTIRTYDR